MKTARCAWEVTAGLVPGTPLPEYTRRWVLLSEEWYDEDGKLTLQGAALFDAHLVAAQGYARTLTRPRSLNWVKVEWIWF